MIESPQNPKIQKVRALLTRRSEREQAGAFVAEGVRLVEEGLLTGWQPQLVLYTGEVSERGRQAAEQFRAAGVVVEEVLPRVLSALTDTETPQGLLAVFNRRELPLPEDLNFIVIADGLRDPGNMGTLLRTAAAAGAQAVILPPGTVDAFSPKVLRSGMGAHFRLPILELDWQAIEALCKQRSHPLKLYLAESEGGVPAWEADFKAPLALVMGSEAEGAGPEARRPVDTNVLIPMPGHFESLNAAVAAGILIFEVVRQRRG